MTRLIHKVKRLLMGHAQPMVAPLVRSPISAEEVAVFERRHGIKLPETYVTSLLAPALFSPFDALSEWAQPEGDEKLPPTFLSNPFPHLEAWNDLSLFDEALGWNSPYFAEDWWRGAMRVSNLGCEGYTLLVVTGPCRGQLWCDLRVSAMKGIFPLTNRSGERLLIEAAWKGFQLRFGQRCDVMSPSQFFEEHINDSKKQ
jgi:hypothetical protein